MMFKCFDVKAFLFECWCFRLLYLRGQTRVGWGSLNGPNFKPLEIERFKMSQGAFMEFSFTAF